MTPKAYLDLYTALPVIDFAHRRLLVVNINAYGSGWGTTQADNRPSGHLCQQEYNGPFKTALRRALDPKSRAALPALIKPPETSPLDAYSFRMFARNGLIRAFLGKGTPQEIADVLLLALALGRIGTAKDFASQKPGAEPAQAYANRFLSLDCNGLVGNFYGLNPETAIESYASPARRRASAQDVRQGDCLVTVTASGRFEHIALVEKFTPGTGDKPTCAMEIVEWGQAGPIDKHYSSVSRTVTRGPNTKFGVGFKAAANGDKFRYFFTPPADAPAEPRQWGLGGAVAQ